MYALYASLISIAIAKLLHQLITKCGTIILASFLCASRQSFKNKLKPSKTFTHN